MAYEATRWKITGTSGLTIKAGTPIAKVEVGASYIRLPIQNINTGESVLLKGAGVGGGFGGSISSPFVSASGSLDNFPSNGIGKIIKGPAGLSRPYEKKDFVGDIMVISLSAGKQVSGQLSGVLWLNQPVERCMINLGCSKDDMRKIARHAMFAMFGIIIPAGNFFYQSHRLMELTRAAGSFVAMNAEAQLIGAGADVFSYWVSV